MGATTTKTEEEVAEKDLTPIKLNSKLRTNTPAPYLQGLPNKAGASKSNGKVLDKLKLICH